MGRVQELQDLGADRVKDKQIGIRVNTGVWVAYLDILNRLLDFPGNCSHNTEGRDDRVRNNRTGL